MLTMAKETKGDMTIRLVENSGGLRHKRTGKHDGHLSHYEVIDHKGKVHLWSLDNFKEACVCFNKAVKAMETASRRLSHKGRQGATHVRSRKA